MFAEDTYFLDLYLLSTLALMITAIVQCWLIDQIKLKKIIWTAAIIITWPFFTMGTIAFAFIYYKKWRKIIPLSIVVILATGSYFQLMEWSKKIPEMAEKTKYYDSILQGKEKNAVSRNEEPSLYIWSEDTSFRVLNMNRNEFKSILENNRNLFTQDGYTSYYEALERAQIIAGLEARRFDIVFERNSLPIQAYIIDSNDQAADWIINVPGQLDYKGLQNSNFQNVIVSIFVKKDSDAFKATQIIVAPAS